MQEKRQNRRLPIIHEIDEPIQLTVNGETVPGVLVDLSAGGMALLTFTSIPVNTAVTVAIDIPGIKTKPLNGSVAWDIPKGELWRIGISFSSIDPIDFRHINRVAFDYSDCDTKLALGVRDICVEKCSCFSFCEKPVKLAVR